MPIIAHLRTAVEDLVTACLDDLPLARRQRLGTLVIGILLSGTLVLRQRATTLAHVHGGAVQAARHERRLRRTLNDAHVEAAPTSGRVVPPAAPPVVGADRPSHH